MRQDVSYKNDNFGFLAFGDFPLLCLNMILCPLCNSNTLWIILILLSRNLNRMRRWFAYKMKPLAFLFFELFPLIVLEFDFVSFCNSNPLHNILMILGRNVEQKRMMCRPQ